MTLTFFFTGQRHAQLIIAYALIRTKPDDIDKFYDYHDSVISATPRTDKFILLGTSVPEWAQTNKPGKESLELEKKESATEMASSF